MSLMNDLRHAVPFMIQIQVKRPLPGGLDRIAGDRIECTYSPEGPGEHRSSHQRRQSKASGSRGTLVGGVARRDRTAKPHPLRGVDVVELLIAGRLLRTDSSGLFLFVSLPQPRPRKPASSGRSPVLSLCDSSAV